MSPEMQVGLLIIGIPLAGAVMTGALPLVEKLLTFTLRNGVLPILLWSVRTLFRATVAFCRELNHQVALRLSKEN